MTSQTLSSGTAIELEAETGHLKAAHGTSGVEVIQDPNPTEAAPFLEKNNKKGRLVSLEVSAREVATPAESVPAHLPSIKRSSENRR